MATQTISLHPHLPIRPKNSTSHFNMDQRNAGFISILHGWKMFQPNLTSKLLQPFSVAALLLKHMLFLQLGLSFPQPAPQLCSLSVCVPLRQFVGRMYISSRLQGPIKQHVPKLIRNHHPSQDRSNFSRKCKTNNTSQITAHDFVLDWKNPSFAS